MIEGLRTWSLDKSHSSLEFSVRHMMISNVKGNFGSFEIDLALNPENLQEGSISGRIDAASIDTNEKDRDNHLRSGDFLDVASYKMITFKSTEISRRDGKVVVVGKLKIRDVEKDVTVVGDIEGPIKDPYGKTRIGYDGEFSLNRRDFGLNWNIVLEAGGLMVGDNVKISIHLEFISN